MNRAPLILVVFVLTASLSPAVILNVDVDSTPYGIETQAGWESLAADGSGDGAATYATAFGTVSIAVSGNGSRNRGDIPGDPLSDVNEDFSYVDGSGGTQTVVIDGLSAGQYRFTTYHYDRSTGGVNLFDLTVLDARGSTKVLDSVDWSLDGHSYLVESDGSQVALQIQEDSGTNRMRFNGIQIDPLEEVLKVDVDSAPYGIETQTGWESLAVNGGGDGSGIYTTLFGDLLVSVSANSSRNRPDIPGDPLSDVNEDFSFSDGLDQTITVTVDGLKAGAYAFTTYHYDRSTGGISDSMFDLTVDDASGSRKVLDSAEWALVGHTYTVRSNGNPVRLLIQEDGIDPVHRARFNGILIAPIPEPASTGLVLLGLATFAGRRRR